MQHNKSSSTLISTLLSVKLNDNIFIHLELYILFIIIFIMRRLIIFSCLYLLLTNAHAEIFSYVKYSCFNRLFSFYKTKYKYNLSFL